MNIENVNLRISTLAKTSCNICGTDIIHRNLDLANICNSFDCVRLEKQRHSLPPQIFLHQVNHHRKIAQKRKQKVEIEKQYHQSLKDSENKENERIREMISIDKPEFENARVLSIPSGFSGIQENDEKRINIYLDHIREMLDNAEKEDISGVHAELELTEETIFADVCNQVCAVCQGGCCTGGGDHAFLTEKTMLRVKQEFPELDDDDIIEMYKSYVPETAINKSCVNQTSMGCALPRELRSDACNNYFCDALEDLQKELEFNDDALPLVIVKRAYNNWNRLAKDADRQVKSTTIMSRTADDNIKVEDFSDF